MTPSDDVAIAESKMWRGCGTGDSMEPVVCSGLSRCASHASQRSSRGGEGETECVEITAHYIPTSLSVLAQSAGRASGGGQTKWPRPR